MLLLTRDVVSTVWRAVFGCFPLPHRWIQECYYNHSNSDWLCLEVCERCGRSRGIT